MYEKETGMFLGFSENPNYGNDRGKKLLGWIMVHFYLMIGPHKAGESQMNNSWSCRASTERGWPWNFILWIFSFDRSLWRIRRIPWLTRFLRLGNSERDLRQMSAFWQDISAEEKKGGKVDTFFSGDKQVDQGELFRGVDNISTCAWRHDSGVTLAEKNIYLDLFQGRSKFQPSMLKSPSMSSLMNTYLTCLLRRSLLTRDGTSRTLDILKLFEIPRSLPFLSF
jgi:hypothetical protein